MSTIIREVPTDAIETSNIGAFLTWVNAKFGYTFTGWDELYAWSITDIEDFWESVWEYFEVTTHSPYTSVLEERIMPHAGWFTGATLNYAEHSLGTAGQADEVAVTAVSQTREDFTLTFAELRAEVARVRAGLIDLGVKKGDRVVGYLPNQPEALVAFLATASLGAIWASCAPEFGTQSVIDRFSQVEPTILLAIPGYMYGNKPVDRSAELAEVVTALPTLTHLVSLDYGDFTLSDDLRETFTSGVGLEHPVEVVDYANLGATSARSGNAVAGTDLEFEPVPFDHPLFILFSSGTTGKPKAIVHSHGGILLETLKNHSLHFDLGPGSQFCWFSTTAWMMWNTLVGGLLLGSSIVMIDGNPNYPDPKELWRIAANTKATLMGVAPGAIMSARKAGFNPTEEFDLSAVSQFGAAGAPLPAEGYEWVIDQFGPEVLLNVGCGGTDVCTGILQASPLTPVYSGEMSGISLGFAATAFDASGNEVIDDLGELVITEPTPSMPVTFWGENGDARYEAAYFDKYPGIWRHGDWAKFITGGGVVVTGRSDATLNRGGVRLGTADFYSVLDTLPEVADALVIHLEDPDGGMGELVLFVQLEDDVPFSAELSTRISRELKTRLSPRHTPDEVVPVTRIPLGRTGKKLEVPVKRIVQGATADSVASAGALQDPKSLDEYVDYAQTRKAAVNACATTSADAVPVSSKAALNVAIIGTGVIGAAWATGFLAAGHTVTAFDPADGAQERLREQVSNFGAEADACTTSVLDNLTFAPSLAEAVANADFVQENGPERLEVKQSMLAEIDAAAPEAAVIASSTSGFSPSQLNALASKAPGRIVVGHPFNPAHLVPLVEVVPSAGTSAVVVERAMETYRAIGKKPILVRAELPGHVANRLQAAMWQEAYSLVDRGVASVTDIDTAISYGPGLRWAILGPLAQQSLSGGAGGMRHVLDHLGPPQEVWMHDLKQVHLDEDLKEKLISGVGEELEGRDPTVLARQRDDMLLEVIALKRKYGELP